MNEKNDVDISTLDSGQTPLTLACLNGHQKAIELLLESGAEPNKPNNFGNTPLICIFDKYFDVFSNLIFKSQRNNNSNKV